jgi:hypothetical protein
MRMSKLTLQAAPTSAVLSAIVESFSLARKAMMPRFRNHTDHEMIKQG